MRARWRWAILALVYLVFLYWYGGWTRPLTPAEVEHYVSIAAKRATADPDLQAARIRTFAESDDGREFFMVNLIKYRDHPVYPDARDPQGDVYAVEWRYGRKMLPKLLSRACHPIAGAQRIVDLATTEGEPAWDRVLLVRYRSRRDFLEIVMAPEFEADVVHKWAAVERTHAFPSKPQISLFSPRLLALLVLVLIGVAVGRLTATRERR